MSGLTPLNKILFRTPIPDIKPGEYEKVRDDFEQRVCFEMLCEMGIEIEEATELSIRFKGTARGRIKQALKFKG